MGRKIEQMRWPGGEHDFALFYGEIEILQDKCDAGPEFIFNSLAGRTYLQKYAFETLRLGLIGGGMPDGLARRLVNDCKENHPLRDFIVPALNVLGAAIAGYEDDKPGEAQGAEMNPTTPEESGGSVASTEVELS